MPLHIKRENPISVRLSAATVAEVRALAAADDERASVLIRRLIRLGLEHTKPTKRV